METAASLNGSVVITATPLSGFLGIYVSSFGDPEPADPKSFDWHTNTLYSGEPLVIKSADKGFPADGKLYIGVYGETPAKYSIVATSKAEQAKDGAATSTSSSSTLLRDGIPQSGHINHGEIGYYTYHVDNSGCKLTFSVTPLSGDPDLFVSRKIEKPTKETSERLSMKFGGDSVIFDPAETGNYYIGVGSTTDSSYGITATSKCSDKESATTLVDGVPQAGILEKGQVDYFKFNVQGAAKDLTISVHRSFGDPDVFVRNDGQKPSPEFHQWASAKMGEDILTISKNDPNICQGETCSYSIAVVAVTDTKYTVSVRTEDALVTLQDGIPLTENLSGYGPAHVQQRLIKSPHITCFITFDPRLPLVVLA